MVQWRDAYSLADIATGCALGYLDLRLSRRVDWHGAHPNLVALADKLAGRPSFADTIPPAARGGYAAGDFRRSGKATPLAVVFECSCRLTRPRGAPQETRGSDGHDRCPNRTCGG